ncbi:MAG TPA: hypothetical protein VIM96_10320 [Pseudomonadales bacterium]
MRYVMLLPLLLLISGCDRMKAPELAVQNANSRVVLAEDPWVDAVRLVAGDAFSCLLWKGSIECWGDNQYGQLDVPENLVHATDISAGDAHACAVNDGRVVCWGNDAAGQATPPALNDVSMVAAGAAHSCALAQAKVVCWGSNQAGQTKVPADLGTVELIAAGKSKTCAATSRDITCWGNLNRTEPLRLLDINNPVALSIGSAQLCGIYNQGMFCRNIETNEEMDSPKRFEPVALSSRHARNCMISPSGLDCWDADGKLATGKKGKGDIRAVAVGGKHVCALYQERVICWGKSAKKGADVLTPPARWQGE